MRRGGVGGGTDRNYARLGFLGLVLGVLVLLGPVASAQDLLEQALAAQKANKHEQAVEMLGQYLKKYPHTPEAWRARAQSLAALERRDEALNDVDLGLHFNPKNIPLMLVRGKMLGELERRPEAIATFTQILTLSPTNTDALKERAESYIQEGQIEKAILDLNRAVALAPTDPWAYHKLGMAELCLNHYKEAAAAFSTAIRLSPETPLFYFSRGEVYLRHLEKKDEAIADFKKGCALGHPLCCRELEMLGVKP
jgi:tetratricopeptide (TPR) repeat protein